MKNHTICVFTENSPGVLQRLTVNFTRRKINIESLTVSETEKEGISRFTIVIKSEREQIDIIAKQIKRIIEVRDVFVAEDDSLLFKEIAFYKIASDKTKRAEVEELAHRYQATISHVEEKHLIVEKIATEEQIDSFYLLLEPYGIKEFVRSGRIAMTL
ncbi:MAG: acetolactate synthase small subunit [Proteobacteria bacterium]|nr:acetolactate synthase small subunit [Pseudomonadota bacterium]